MTIRWWHNFVFAVMNMDGPAGVPYIITHFATGLHIPLLLGQFLRLTHRKPGIDGD